MSIQVKLYSFAKKENSTAIPTTAALVADIPNAIINDGATSLLAPAITIPVTAPAILTANYCYIDAFGRYYNITDWRYNGNGTWTAICTVDALASWRTDVRSCSGYLQRCTQFVDDSVIDTFYPATTDYIVKWDQELTHMSKARGDGTFIVGVLTTNASPVGSGGTLMVPTLGVVTYYILTAEQFAQLCYDLMAQTDSGQSFDDITSISPDVLKSFVDPIQFIVSCKWFPFNVSAVFTANDYSTPSDPLAIYSWQTHVTGYKKLNTKTDFDFPKDNNGTEQYYSIYIHDLFTRDDAVHDRREYPSAAPYAEYDLITPWGSFSLDSTVVHDLLENYPVVDTQENRNCARIDWKLVGSAITGEATLIVRGHRGSGEPFEFFRKEIALAMDLPLAQVLTDYKSIVSARGGAITSHAGALADILGAVGKSFSLAGGAGGAMSAIGGGISSGAETGMSIGSHAINYKINQFNATAAYESPLIQSTGEKPTTFTRLIEYIYVQQIRHKTTEQSNATYGRPYPHFVQNLQAFGGFVQFDTALLTSHCTDTERAAIVSLLQSGVYIE